MILEGIVTTLTAAGGAHIAPMGPEIDATLSNFILKPFQTSQTFRNLAEHPEGVFHVTDDVLLLAQAAIGQISPAPAIEPARGVRGFYLQGACKYFEFRVVQSDISQPRARLQAQVVRSTALRDFLGFNRAKHAVVEAAILATRIHLLPLNDMREEFDRLEVLVEKTGGDQEWAAFGLLRARLDQAIRLHLSEAGDCGPEKTPVVRVEDGL